jgi:thiosulfate dehydrogenase
MAGGTAVLLLMAVACNRPAPAPPARTVAAAPTDSEIPNDAFGVSVRRGLALLTATKESLPKNDGSALRCVSCHLDQGRRANGSWIGSFARFPQYRPRRGAVELIEDRVNDCLARSLNGKGLDPASADMRDIVAYLAFLSWRSSVGIPTAGPNARLVRFASLTADTTAGHQTFGTSCARCHGPDGQGTPVAPPLWGPKSFNIGAGMARVRTAASFVRDNMPFDQPGTLTDQQAFDVAAFVVAQPRPDFPGKQFDWPHGDPPPDVAYPTLAAAKKPAGTGH